MQHPEISIRDVLNHTSGITNYTEHEEFWNNYYDYEKSISLGSMISFSEQFPLDFKPKSKWSYSNTGYIIAGNIVEAVTSKTWDEYISETFLKPLNMTQTGYSDYFDSKSLVKSYVKNKASYDEQPQFNYSYAASAGGIYSTLDDLLKWTAIYDSSELLSSDSKVDMQKVNLKNYGLGILISNYKNDIEISHGGSVSGFVTSLGYLKKSKIAIIALENVNGEQFDIYSLLRSFFYEGRATAIKLKTYSLTTEEMQEFVGSFSNGSSFSVRIYIENGQMFLKTNDEQPPYLLRANDKDSFNILDYFGEEFIRNENGKIIGMKHYQDGRISYLAKVAN